MRVFHQDGKVNFVDENNVVLGYEIEHQCCETPGWFIADVIVIQGEIDPTKKILKDDLIDRTKDEMDLTDWRFDPAFFKSITIPAAQLIADKGEEADHEDCMIAVFRIVNGAAEKFVHLFNIQNGYYTHDFNFTIGGCL